MEDPCEHAGVEEYTIRPCTIEGEPLCVAASSGDVALLARDRSATGKSVIFLGCEVLRHSTERNRAFAELEAWGELCAQGFSHRPGAPDRYGSAGVARSIHHVHRTCLTSRVHCRFLRKYLCDPYADAEGVRLAVCPHGRLCASVRVFTRTWTIAGRAVPVAGVGEVCTHPDFRGRGLSTVLLSDAIAYMTTRTSASVSALHAAPAVRPLYARFGYAPLTVPYGRCTVRALLAMAGQRAPGMDTSESGERDAHMCVSASTARVRGVRVVADRVDWADSTCVAEIARMHVECMDRWRVSGVTQRSPAYWGRWLPNALRDAAAWVLREAHDDSELHGDTVVPPSMDSPATFTASPVQATASPFGLPRDDAEWPSVDTPMSPCPEADMAERLERPVTRPARRILAYACVLRKSDAYKLCDFACAADATPQQLCWLLAHATASACDADATAGIITTSHPNTRSCCIPTRVMRHVCAMLGSPSAAGDAEFAVLDEEHSDTGWMLRPVQYRTPDIGDPQQHIDALRRASDAGDFLVWIADSF